MVLLVTIAASVSQAQNARIVLRWKDVPGASAYELQIAKDPAFVEIVLQTRTTSAGYRWEQLPTTTHWWRVRSFDAESRASEWSPPRTIAVDSAVPTPLKPADGQAVSCGSTVSFELEPSPLIKEYILELAGSADFGSFRTLRSSTPSFEVPNLPAGTWWWRTRGVDLKARTGGPGPVRSLPVRVQAPRLKQAADVPLGTSQVQLSWSEAGCAKSYLVEATQDGRDKVSFPVTGLSMAFKAGVAGDYRWRVASVDERGNAGEFSAESTFKVKLPSPNGRSENVGLRTDLSWSAVVAASGYKVELLRAGRQGAGERGERHRHHHQLAHAGAAAGPVLLARHHPRRAGPHLGAVRAAQLREVGRARRCRRFGGSPRRPRARWWRPAARSSCVGPTSPSARTSSSSSTARRSAWRSRRRAWPRSTEGSHTVRVRAVGEGYRLSPWTEPLELFVGVPEVATAEVALVGELLRVRLVDARGREVRGAAPKLSVRDGSLGPTEFKDERWQAQWNPPASGSDLLRVEERAFRLEHPLEAASDPFFTAAVRGGGIFSGGAVASPTAQVSFGVRLPFLRRRVGVELRAAGYRAASALDVGGASLRGEAWLVPLSVLASWNHNLGAFQLKAGAGFALQLAWLQVGPDARFAAVPGFEAVVALSRRVGPGRVELELSYLYGRVDNALARLNAGGVAVRVGYAFDF